MEKTLLVQAESLESASHSYNLSAEIREEMGHWDWKKTELDNFIDLFDGSHEKSILEAVSQFELHIRIFKKN
ncbi:hypothetical protein [Paenibacillus chitinolyticus]